MPCRTFAIDLLADTLCSLVFDRSVTTIDVEQGALENPSGATDEEYTGKPGTKPSRGPARHPSKAAAGPLSNGPHSVGVFVEGAAVRHIVWWVVL
jgi:hypothetical protein